MKTKNKFPFKLPQHLLVFFVGLFLFQSAIFAQCIIGNELGRNDPENDFFWGQSFTATCDGLLEYLEFITGNEGGL